MKKYNILIMEILTNNYNMGLKYAYFKFDCNINFNFANVSCRYQFDKYNLK